MRISIWPASNHSWPDPLRLAHHAADRGWDDESVALFDFIAEEVAPAFR